MDAQLESRLPGLKGALKILSRINTHQSQRRAFNDINENYTDLVEANGLRDRRHKHDDGNCKALKFTWSLVRLKSSILVP